VTPGGEQAFAAATLHAGTSADGIPTVPAGPEASGQPLGELPTPLLAGDDPVEEPPLTSGESRVITVQMKAVETSLADAFPNY
jgi:hypothetical protein